MARCPEWSRDGPATRGTPFRRAVAEVCRHVEASSGTLFLNHTTIPEWHQRIFRDFVPLPCYAGNYRQVHALMVCLNIPVYVAGVPGSPAPVVLQHMRSLIDEFRGTMLEIESTWGTLTEVERAERIAATLALLIGRFIQIHPFVNGNGRASRILWFWGLRRFGYPPQFCIANHPDHPPYNELMAQSMRGDFDELGLYILRWLGTKPPRR